MPKPWVVAVRHPTARRYGLVLCKGNQAKQVTLTVIASNDGTLANDLRGDAQMSIRASYFRKQPSVIESFGDEWDMAYFSHAPLPPLLPPRLLSASVFAPPPLPALCVSPLDFRRRRPGSRGTFLGKCRAG